MVRDCPSIRLTIHLSVLNAFWQLGNSRKAYSRILKFHILSTARRFEKIAGKGGGVEYLILNLYTPRGHVQWNVQSMGYIISFRIYDSYFHHCVRGCGAGVTLPRSMRVNFFLRFSYRFFPPFLSLSLSSYFPFLSSPLAGKRDIVVTILVLCMCGRPCVRPNVPDHNLYNAWISKQFGTVVALEEEKCHLKHFR